MARQICPKTPGSSLLFSGKIFGSFSLASDGQLCVPFGFWRIWLFVLILGRRETFFCVCISLIAFAFRLDQDQSAQCPGPCPSIWMEFALGNRQSKTWQLFVQSAKHWTSSLKFPHTHTKKEAESHRIPSENSWERTNTKQIGNQNHAPNPLGSHWTWVHLSG